MDDRPMDLRRFGTTDLRVSQIGLGCARVGGIFQGGAAPFLELLDLALDRGINFFDTADMYSQGESEAILGRAFRGRRDRVILASKAGYKLPAQRRLAGRIKPLLRPLIRAFGLRRENLPPSMRGTPSQDFSPSYLRKAVEGSLRRLATDRLDLFQLHSPTAEVVQRGDWLAALEALKREGKIRWYGVSCDTPEAARAALQHEGVSALQLPLSLLDRRMLEILPLARGRGVAVIARECLANGLLAREQPPPPGAEEQDGRISALPAVRKLASASGCSLPQLALHFVAALEGVSVTLVGARTPQQLVNLLGQFEVPPAPEALRAVQG
jgi:aryl-alcohol dehydrogenase-like predicted oxidoreductase